MKRFLKGTIVDVTSRRSAISSIALDRWILSLLGMGFDPPRNPPSYPGGSKSACVISIDFDHLTKSSRSDNSRWYPEPRENLLKANSLGTSEMISQSEKYEIPMTWAICGHTAEADEKSFEKILSSSQAHEVGVHTYSHIDVASATPQELTEDIERCLSVLRLKDQPKTFIFPWNRTGNFDVLRKFGFRVFRDPKRMIRAPFDDHGLIDIPPTYYVDLKSTGATELMKKYLELCIAWNCTFHLWLHPWSVVAGEKEVSFVSKTLDPFFAFIKKRRDDGVLSTSTMGEIATFQNKA